MSAEDFYVLLAEGEALEREYLGELCLQMVKVASYPYTKEKVQEEIHDSFIKMSGRHVPENVLVIEQNWTELRKLRKV